VHDERDELGLPGQRRGAGDSGAVPPADLCGWREEEGPDNTGALKGDEDDVGRPSDTTCRGLCEVGGEVDGSAENGPRVPHGGPDPEEKPTVVGQGVGQHGSTLADVKETTGDTADSLASAVSKPDVLLPQAGTNRYRDEPGCSSLSRRGAYQTRK
jgi:hypothetical protein